jgi:CubicO group peptidase (beta-lactamase class C family)
MKEGCGRRAAQVKTMKPLPNFSCRVAAVAAAVWSFTLAIPAAACVDASSTASIESVVRNFMAAHHLRAVIVQVRSNGSNVYTGAFGDSMTGVPATVDMHFRNGAFAFTYMATLLLEFVDQKKVTLDTKLSAFFPGLPRSNQITLKDLAQMTSGYADYVYQDEFQDALYRDPFRQWTPEELIQIGVSKPEQFPAGTNWAYSHTNYVILGRVLEKIAGTPLTDALQRFVLEKMVLKQTTASTTALVPQPVLHSYTSERRQTLGVKPGVPFYEEATYWNPSWTTIDGAVETTDITDASASIEAVAAGKLLSPASSAAQITPSLIGFGHAQANCPACRQMTTALSYGLGVILSGRWVTQTLGFAGASGAVGNLRAKKLTIAVEATNGPGASDENGQAPLGAVALFRALADLLAPGTLPPESR